MSTHAPLSFERTLYVRDTCLCFSLQRAARAIARHFDEAFRPFGLTNGQFSLLMSLNRPSPPAMGEVAALLAMDRTTLTAALKPLERRGLAGTAPDETDKRTRRIMLTDAGRSLLGQAYPVWEAAHRDIEARFPPERLAALRADVQQFAAWEAERQGTAPRTR
jgi:DNA-binding MarR family transcriptional regulator